MLVFNVTDILEYYNEANKKHHPVKYDLSNSMIQKIIMKL